MCTDPHTLTLLRLLIGAIAVACALGILVWIAKEDNQPYE